MTGAESTAFRLRLVALVPTFAGAFASLDLTGAEEEAAIGAAF